MTDKAVESEEPIRLKEESYTKIADLLSNPPEFNEAMIAAIENSRTGIMKMKDRSRSNISVAP